MKKLVLLLTVFTAMALTSVAQISTSTPGSQTTVGPLPSATFAGISSGDLTKLNLTKYDTLSTTNNKFVVISFHVTATVAGTRYNIAATTNKFNADIKTLIGKMEVGNTIHFENIKAKQKATGNVHSLASLTFTIK
jgi:hypothetical protein